MHTKFLKFLHKSSRTTFISFILFQGLKLKIYRSVLMSSNWVDISKDTNTGIETIRAHFTGHAYDPHWHSSYLIGVTESGIQQFHCRKKQINSHAGQVFMLEPEEIHDGHAPASDGFTYQMLYLHPEWLKQRLQGLFHNSPDHYELVIDAPLKSDDQLAIITSQAFRHLHYKEMNIVKDNSLDVLIQYIAQGKWLKKASQSSCINVPQIAHQIRDILHDHLFEDIGLEDISRMVGLDRYHIHRIFKSTFHLAPHQYLIQLRLTRARDLLARSISPAQVASDLCFSDQSHLSRWFKRCYGLTPAAYRKICTNLQD